MIDLKRLNPLGFNLLVGPTGSGKTVAALDYVGRLAQEQAVVYITSDDLVSVAGRWQALKARNGLSDGLLYFYTQGEGLTTDPALLLDFIQLARAKSPHVIVIDDINRSAVGLETSLQKTSTFISGCQVIRGELKCGILGIYRTGKDSKARHRGPKALYAAADAVLLQVTSASWRWIKESDHD